MSIEINPELNGMTSLMVAAAEGDAQAVKDAIAQGVDLNETDNRRATALMYAAANQRLDIVDALLTAGADPTVKTYKYSTALDFARQVKSEEIVRRISSAIDMVNEIIEQKKRARALHERRMDEVIRQFRKGAPTQFFNSSDSFFDKLSRLCLGAMSNDPKIQRKLDESEEFHKLIEDSEACIRTLEYRSKIIDVESKRLMELAKQGGIEFENQMELMDKLENEMAALTRSAR